MPACSSSSISRGPSYSMISPPLITAVCRSRCSVLVPCLTASSLSTCSSTPRAPSSCCFSSRDASSSLVIGEFFELLDHDVLGVVAVAERNAGIFVVGGWCDLGDLVLAVHPERDRRRKVADHECRCACP